MVAMRAVQFGSSQAFVAKPAKSVAFKGQAPDVVQFAGMSHRAKKRMGVLGTLLAGAAILGGLAGCGSSPQSASAEDCRTQYIERVKDAYANGYPQSSLISCEKFSNTNAGVPTNYFPMPSKLTTQELKDFLGPKYDEVKDLPAFQTKDMLAGQQQSAGTGQ